MQTTVATPIGNTRPDGGVQVTWGLAGFSSVAVALNSTFAPSGLIAVTVMSDGTVITGGVVSDCFVHMTARQVPSRRSARADDLAARIDRTGTTFNVTCEQPKRHSDHVLPHVRVLEASCVGQRSDDQALVVGRVGAGSGSPKAAEVCGLSVNPGGCMKHRARGQGAVANDLARVVDVERTGTSSRAVSKQEDGCRIGRPHNRAGGLVRVTDRACDLALIVDRICEGRRRLEATATRRTRWPRGPRCPRSRRGLSTTIRVESVEKPCHYSIMARYSSRSWRLGLAGAVLLVVLAGSSTATSSPTGRLRRSTGLTRLLPPPDGKAYFGFTFRLYDTSDPVQGDARPFSNRIHDAIQYELAGKTPTFLAVWAPWAVPGPEPTVPFSHPGVRDFVAKAKSVTGSRSLLYLDWTITATTARNGGITTKDIASGALDEYIRQYARDLKAYADPVLVRLFGGEFNGSWSYGQSPRANPSLTPSDFVSAWRRVVDIFRQVGVPNVSWAWIPNVFPPTPVDYVDPNIDAYYPGDDYVDWAGADIYSGALPSWLDPIYSFAVAHTKPVFVAEWGLRHEGGGTPQQEQAWLGAMFDYFENHPGIKAINYFNYNSRPDNGIPWDGSHAVYLYGGQVNYLPNVNDTDYTCGPRAAPTSVARTHRSGRRPSLPDFDPRRAHRPSG